VKNTDDISQAFIPKLNLYCWIYGRSSGSSRLLMPSPPIPREVAYGSITRSVNRRIGLTAAGTAPVFHRIPFSSYFWYRNFKNLNSPTKIVTFFNNNNFIEKDTQEIVLTY